MARAAALFTLLAVAAVACERTTPATDPSTSPSSTPPPPSAVASAAPSATAPSVARPQIGITNVFPGTIAIENTSDAPVRLATKPTIERLDTSGVWVTVQGLDLEGTVAGKGIRLVERCEDTPADCFEIAPHATFHPVRWSGMSCSAQCNGTCRANAFMGGRYRWVVQQCGGAAVPGPSFDLPPELAEHGRVGVTDALVSGVAMRLNAPLPKWEPASPPATGTILGLPIRPGSERPIDPADLATLVALLRDAKHFDDQIEKRCLKSTFVGLRLTRRPASTIPTHDEIAEVFVDFTCNSLFIAHDGEGPTHPRVVFATYFDPSRADFVALVKKLIPGDGELAKLK